jgi:hypothetical protein
VCVYVCVFVFVCVSNSYALLGPDRSLCFRKKISTDVRRLTTGIRSEQCAVRRFRRCANVIECTYTKLYSIAYYTPTLYGISYCS